MQSLLHPYISLFLEAHRSHQIPRSICTTQKGSEPLLQGTGERRAYCSSAPSLEAPLHPPGFFHSCASAGSLSPEPAGAMCLSAHLDTARLCLYRLSYLGAAELTAETRSAFAPSRGVQALRKRGSQGLPHLCVCGTWALGSKKTPQPSLCYLDKVTSLLKTLVSSSTKWRKQSLPPDEPR